VGLVVLEFSPSFLGLAIHTSLTYENGNYRKRELYFIYITHFSDFFENGDLGQGFRSF
jgi:hypothetical protein